MKMQNKALHGLKKKKNIMKKYYDEIILKKYMDFFPPILMADDYLATDKILIIYILKRSLACTSCKPKC